MNVNTYYTIEMRMNADEGLLGSFHPFGSLLTFDGYNKAKAYIQGLKTPGIYRIVSHKTDICGEPIVIGPIPLK